MRVFILGLHSAIGRHLTAALGKRGHRISGTSRAKEARKDLLPYLDDYHSLQLGDAADPGWFRNSDAVIYLAHDHDRNAAQRNVEGTRAWYRSAGSAGVTRHLFCTSYSAKPDSHSTYGAVKFELETFFRANRQWLVRPGLVAGPEGLFGTMLRLVRRLPFLPLLDGGRHPMPLVAPASVSAAVIYILEHDLAPGNWNLHRPDPVSMKELLSRMRVLSGSHCRFIPVPSILPLVLLRSCEVLGIRLPMGADSIAALRENRDLRRPSHLADLKVKDPPLDEQILRLIRTAPGGRDA